VNYVNKPCISAEHSKSQAKERNVPYSIEEVRHRIEAGAKKLGLNAEALMREYGVTTALAEMLEREVKT
jgi:hypothetical protein